MKDKFLQSIKEMEYANLGKDQEVKLRDIEKDFNNEFGTDYYLMAMKRDSSLAK